MWKFLLISIIAAVSTSPLSPGLAPSCEEFDDEHVCKDASGTLLSFHSKFESEIVLVNPVKLGLSSIAPAAFKHPKMTTLLMTSFLHGLNESCTPTIINFTSESFHGSPSLEEIRLICVGLRGSQDIFKNINSLKSLMLIANKFTEFPRQFLVDIQHLERLEVSSQHIKTLSPASFDDVHEGLEGLNLYSNELESIESQSFARFHHLKTLSLEKNRLEVLNLGMFDGLHELETLDLGNNRLKEITPKTFSGLGNLRELKLGGNRLESFPDGIFNDTRNLEVLSLDGNPISTILPQNLFRALSKLKDLSLGFSERAQIEPNGFSGLDFDDFRLNGDELNSLNPGTFNNLCTFDLVLTFSNTINWKPNLFKGLKITGHVMLYAPNLREFDDQRWGFEKNVMIFYRDTSKPRYLNA